MTAAMMAWIGAAFMLPMDSHGQANIAVPVPSQAPVIPEVPDRRAEHFESDLHDRDISLENENEDEEFEGEDFEDDESEGDEDELALLPPMPPKNPRARNSEDEESSVVLGPAPIPGTWSLTEINDAKQQCGNLLADALYAYEPLDPIRNGICGTPAPILLSAVSTTQTVTIRPAAKLNCIMAAAFHRWIAEVVEPAAQKHLEHGIAGVINVASYHCRTRYNDPAQRMSQHAFANALDIAGFITEKGEQISLEKHWPGDTPRSRFLKDVHAGACRIFGTVLGPESNAAHRDHFHFDMTVRRYGSYCR